MEDREKLELQWRQIWPNMSQSSFEGLLCGGSDLRLTICPLSPCSSWFLKTLVQARVVEVINIHLKVDVYICHFPPISDLLVCDKVIE